MNKWSKLWYNKLVDNIKNGVNNGLDKNILNLYVSKQQQKQQFNWKKMQTGATSHETETCKQWLERSVFIL